MFAACIVRSPVMSKGSNVAAFQSTTSSGVDWTDCWWIVLQQQWVHTLWGMFAIKPTSETDGKPAGHTGGTGHSGSMKQIGVLKNGKMS